MRRISSSISRTSASVAGADWVGASMAVSAKYSSQNAVRLEREQRPGRGADVEREDAAELDRERVGALSLQPLDEHGLVAASQGEVHGLLGLGTEALEHGQRAAAARRSA